MLLLLYAANGHAEMYKWTDEKGKVHLSDKRPRHLKSKNIRLGVNTYESVSYDASIFDTGKKIVMYSTEWCAYCKNAKRHFASNALPFTEYDIERDPRARKLYKRMGAKGVPVILVGNKRMNGFSERGFEKIYD